VSNVQRPSLEHTMHCCSLPVRLLPSSCLHSTAHLHRLLFALISFASLLVPFTFGQLLTQNVFTLSLPVLVVRRQSRRSSVSLRRFTWSAFTALLLCFMLPTSNVAMKVDSKCFLLHSFSNNSSRQCRSTLLIAF
jgi:hypothetical protein